MSTWKDDIEGSIHNFIEAANLASVQIKKEDFYIEYLESPHKPPKPLPQGRMAVYGFWFDNKWLKIGMVGSNSNPRYVSQHYNPRSAPSNLAKSLSNDKLPDEWKFDREHPGEWIKSQTNRVNIVLDSSYGKLLLAYLEAFLHLRLRPRYED